MTEIETETAAAVNQAMCPFVPQPGFAIGTLIENRRTKAGILLPDHLAREKPRKGQNPDDALVRLDRADFRVVCLGPTGSSDFDGRELPWHVKVGDVVRLSALKGLHRHITTGGTLFAFFQQEDIVATVRQETE